MWIEIAVEENDFNLSVSLPLRECGLKSVFYEALWSEAEVTPLAGVWIEILIL